MATTKTDKNIPTRKVTFGLMSLKYNGACSRHSSIRRTEKQRELETEAAAAADKAAEEAAAAAEEAAAAQAAAEKAAGTPAAAEARAAARAAAEQQQQQQKRSSSRESSSSIRGKIAGSSRHRRHSSACRVETQVSQKTKEN